MARGLGIFEASPGTRRVASRAGPGQSRPRAGRPRGPGRAGGPPGAVRGRRQQASRGCCGAPGRPGRPPDPVALMVRLRLYDTARVPCATSSPLARSGVAVPVWRHSAGSAAHRAHQFWCRLRHPDPLAGAIGFRVTFVRNVTDIDDKIIRAPRRGSALVASGARNERAFSCAYEVLGCCAPGPTSRGLTGHVPEMITLMHRLIGADTHTRPTGSSTSMSASLPGVRPLSPASGWTTCVRPTDTEPNDGQA